MSLYTQTDEDETNPADFARRWLEAANPAPQQPPMEHAPRPYDPELGTSKNYFFGLAGVPSITFEIADETTKHESGLIGKSFADALIDVFLEEIESVDDWQLPIRDYFHLMGLANSASLIALVELGLTAESSEFMSKADALEIYAAQKQTYKEIEAQTRATSSNYLDLEEALLEKVGTQASNAHLGRSRQDLHGITRRMLARDGLVQTMEALLSARETFLEVSRGVAHTPIPIFTHGVPAQPSTLGHQFNAFSNALARDFDRLRNTYERMNRSQLGAMAGVGSSIEFDLHRMAMLLGFKEPIRNAFDANFLSTTTTNLRLVML